MSKNKSLEELKEELAKIDNFIGYLEDRQGFAPRDLKTQYWAIRDEIEKREK